MRILLREAEPVLHDVLREGMEDEGHTVVSFPSLDALYAAATEHAGDVALVDDWEARSPDHAWAGLAALGAVIPTVLVGDRQGRSGRSAEARGVAAYLPLPYSLDAVLETVRSAPRVEVPFQTGA